ncbi:toll-like receptor 4 [Mytilus californianus]|uniref:toll-like receptor 4 n=1 Tax=Mytilus californianus TaxID=6549 RepID=UPI00224749E1|nr:toll-like receptor 4 [Mytilus californianus]
MNNDERIVFLLLMMWTMFIYDAKTLSCNYSFNFKEQLMAHCDNRGFISVPRNLNRNIQVLDLSNNLITVIENNTLKNYTKMDILILNSNNISEVHEYGFEGLLSLKILRMENNVINISQLPSRVFRPLDKLMVLEIGRNEQQSAVNGSFVYPDNAFSTLKSLQNLSMDLFDSPEFGDGFKSLQNLTVLKFRRCYLRFGKLSNETFRNFPTKLRELYITRCHHFFHIDKGMLQYFPELKILDLSRSYIHLYQALNILYPYQNKNMSVINFHHISDKSINNDKFPYSIIITKELMRYIRSICIEALDLSATGIVDDEFYSLFSFQYPKCFKTFIISANRLPSTTLEHYMQTIVFITKATNLKTYDMSYLPGQFLQPLYLDVYHPEKFIESQEKQHIFQKSLHIIVNLPPLLEFVRFTHMTVMSASVSFTCKNASLKYFDVSYSVFEQYPNVSHECGKELRYLDVSGLSSTMMFKSISLPELITLKMTHASIDRSIIEGKQWMLGHAPKLKSIDLSFNNLWTLLDTKLFNDKNITHFNLSNNLFRTVPSSVSKLRHIESLDLSNNLITSIDYTIRKWFDEIIVPNQNFSLNLDNNALICSCDTVEFLLWLTKTEVSFVNGNNYTCTMSNNSQVNLIEVTKNINRYFADCKATLWLRIAIVLVSCSFGVSIPLSILYYYRWKLILFSFRKFRRAVERGLHVNYEYDVYISYEERSISWIKNQLLPKAEKEWGLKTFVHDRDLIPGELTSDSKALSIHKSRHIIFIITERFGEYEWGKFEIERAKYEKYTQNLMKIIVILQHVHVNDIPEQLVDISNDVIFINWYEHETEISENQTAWFKLKTLLFLN